MWVGTQIDCKIENYPLLLESRFNTTDCFSIRITTNTIPECLSISRSISPHWWTRHRDIWTSLFREATLLWPRMGNKTVFQMRTIVSYLKGADPHPSRFTLGCKLSKHELEITVRWGEQGYIICKNQRRNLEATELDSLRCLAAPRNSVPKNLWTKPEKKGNPGSNYLLWPWRRPPLGTMEERTDMGLFSWTWNDSPTKFWEKSTFIAS